MAVNFFAFCLLFLNMYLGRLNYRVEYSIFLAATAFLLFSIQISESRIEKFSDKFLIAVLIVLSVCRIQCIYQVMEKVVMMHCLFHGIMI